MYRFDTLLCHFDTTALVSANYFCNCFCIGAIFHCCTFLLLRGSASGATSKLHPYRSLRWNYRGGKATATYKQVAPLGLQFHFCKLICIGAISATGFCKPFCNG